MALKELTGRVEENGKSMPSGSAGSSARSMARWAARASPSASRATASSRRASTGQIGWPDGTVPAIAGGERDSRRLWIVVGKPERRHHGARERGVPLVFVHLGGFDAVGLAQRTSVCSDCARIGAASTYGVSSSSARRSGAWNAASACSGWPRAISSDPRAAPRSFQDPPRLRRRSGRAAAALPRRLSGGRHVGGQDIAGGCRA
jgi:hypothetical protein